MLCWVIKLESILIFGYGRTLAFHVITREKLIFNVLNVESQML